MPCPYLRHEDKLHVVGDKMDDRHQHECPADPVQQGEVVILDGTVNALLEQERNADVGRGIERYRQYG